MKKKLLVLGAGVLQAKLIQAAKELGYYTIVASIEGNYPGFSVADDKVIVDITKPEDVLKAAAAIQVEGVATCCFDSGMKALGRVCDQLQLPGLSEKAATCCNDKYAMKQALQKANVNTARFYTVYSEEDLLKARDELGFPCVFKALDLQGSKGVFICHDMLELERAYAEAKEESRVDFFIMEEFISGNEMGAQAFVYQGEILYILPHGDYTFMSKTAIPVGHYVPLDVSEEIENAAILECEKAIRALGLDNCAVNIDLIEKNGKIYVIELTGRAGATCLPELVSIYYGLDYYKMIAMTAMGEDPRPFFYAGEHKKVANASHMLISDKTGRIVAIHGVEELRKDPDIYEVSLIVDVGDHVHRYEAAIDRLGQVIVQGNSYPDCVKKLQYAMGHIGIDIE